MKVRPVFVPGPEAGGSGGSGLYWFVCNLNPSLCIGLFLCHPPGEVEAWGCWGGET